MAIGRQLLGNEKSPCFSIIKQNNAFPLIIYTIMLNRRIEQPKQNVKESMMPMLHHFNWDTKAVTTTIQWHLGQSFLKLLHCETQKSADFIFARTCTRRSRSIYRFEERCKRVRRASMIRSN